jgi:FHS family glucose/mannose:H+ symporter-like MFS transporter
MFLYAVYIGAISLLWPAAGAAFHIGSAMSGRLFLVNFAGFIAGVLYCGYLSDRFGRKKVLLVGTALYAAGLVLFGAAPSFEVTLLASLLIGSGSGAMETVAFALAVDVYPEKRAFILNGVQVAFGAGASISPSLADLLMRHGVGWRLVFDGVAALTVVLLAALAVQSVPRAAGGAEALNFAQLRPVFKQPVFLLLCIANLLYVGAELGFFSSMPRYFQQSMPAAARLQGAVVTAFWIAMTIGRIACTVIVSKVSVLRFILILAAGAAAFAALALVWLIPGLVFCFVIVTGLCMSGIFSLILSEAGERYPDIAGTVFGVVMAVGGIGGAVVPWLMGVVAETTLGWRGALLAIPACAAGVGAIAAGLMRKSS